MKQFILNSEPDRNGRVRLEGSDYRYLARVRRLAPGEYFPALLPGGAAVTVRVCSIDNQVLTGEVTQNTMIPDSLSKSAIILFQSLPKGEKMDLIVRQAAEGGLHEIVPFASEFSAMKAEKCSAHKISRWERIIKEARQQSGSATATTIRQPMTMDGLFTYWEHITAEQPGALGLLFHHVPSCGGLA
ncbi:MAG: 16S rRNA (uracil(1498)-N(3))-methyltransferase, partial [Treponema sp.]|nr:16S rRNA (uracil(1498)-N(3))-methyltransferase [Treponema sp.]